MTNGEKIKAMFPTFEFIKETEKDRTPQHQFLKVYGVNKMPYMAFDLGWWNAEYKEPTKNDLADDLISRNEVLNRLASIAKVKAKSDAQKSLMGRCMFMVERMPPVTPQESRWISVSEKLPEEYNTVIASTDIGVVYPEARYSKEYGWEWAYESGMDYWEETESNVLAWMPLPQSYKAESEET